MRILLVTALVACAAPETPPAATDHTGTAPTFTLPGDLVVGEASNASYEAEWTIAASQLRAEMDASVSWDRKTADAWGLARAPDTFDLLRLVRAGVTATEATELLALEALGSPIAASWELEVEGLTAARLSDLGGFDPALFAEDPSASWMLQWLDREGPREEVRDALHLTPTEAQPGTTLSVPDGAARYTFAARFGPDELRTDEGHAVYTLDWSGLTTDAYGKPLDPARIDEVFVGRFDDVNEADDLAGDVLDLEAVASAWWTVAPAGTTAILTDARDAGGATFPGFTADTSWLVGGRCTTCAGPAPLWLTIVDVRRP